MHASKHETIIISRTIWTGAFRTEDPVLDGQVDYPFIVQLAHDLMTEDDPMIEVLIDIGEARLHISRTSPNSFALSVIQEVTTITV